MLTSRANSVLCLLLPAVHYGNFVLRMTHHEKVFRLLLTLFQLVILSLQLLSTVVNNAAGLVQLVGSVTKNFLCLCFAGPSHGCP